MLKQRNVVMDGGGKCGEALENIFVVDHGWVGLHRRRARRFLLDAAHLSDGHPEIPRHDVAERKRIVAELQALAGSFEEFKVEIEIELLARRQIAARNRL